MKKSTLKSLIKEIEEDHGLGFSHNVSFTDGAGERDPLNDPVFTGKKPFKEYSDPLKRKQAVKATAYSPQTSSQYMEDPDRGMKLIFQWVKNGTIDFKEFKDLIEYHKATHNTM